MKRWILSIIFSIFIVSSGECYEIFEIKHKGKKQVVHYDLVMPKKVTIEKLPVLVCVGGLHLTNGVYYHSDPRECTGKKWEGFAQKNQIAVLGLGFKHDSDDWKNKESYQYAQAWSGKALKRLLRQLSRKHSLDPNKLMLFGVSAGAQFSVRYAFYNHKDVLAVAAHAAGGYDKPKKFIKTKFLITVGSEDNAEVSRVDWAKFFVKHARDKAIDVRPVVIEGLAHRQTEEQNQMSREFFTEALREKAR